MIEGRPSDRAERSPVRWYVMLFPSPEGTAAITSMLRELADEAGGMPNDSPHVTIGYFHGIATPEAVAAAVRMITGPPVRIFTDGLFGWSEAPHPRFGFTLSFSVRRDQAIRTWQRSARTALAPLGLAPIFAWQAQRPHMNALRDMPRPPADALRQLADRDIALAWDATRLLASYESGSDYVTFIDQPLGRDTDVTPA
jgi:2'-5' RNA ligase